MSVEGATLPVEEEPLASSPPGDSAFPGDSAPPGDSEPVPPGLAPGVARSVCLRRNLVSVPGGIVKDLRSAEFVDLLAARVDLSDPVAVFGVLVVSFSVEDEKACVRWRIAIDGEPGAGQMISESAVSKVETGGRPRSLTVYGASPVLPTGKHAVRVQVSSDRPTTLWVRRGATSGAEVLRLLVFELP